MGNFGADRRRPRETIISGRIARRGRRSEDQGPRAGHKSKSKRCQKNRAEPSAATRNPVRVRPGGWARRPVMVTDLGMPLGIVARAAHRIGQYLVGFVDVLEPHGRPRCGIAVWVVPPCQAAEGCVDLGPVGRVINLEHRVIIKASANQWRHAISLFLSPIVSARSSPYALELCTSYYRQGSEPHDICRWAAVRRACRRWRTGCATRPEF